MTWHAVNYEMGDRSTVFACKYFDSVDGMSRNADLEGVLYVENDEGGSFYELNWTHNELRSSFSDNVRLSAQSASDDFRTAFAADVIWLPTDVRSVLLLTRQNAPAVVDLQSSNVAQVLALS